MSYHFLTYRFLLLLVLSLSTIGHALGKQSTMLQSLLELQHSPSPYECAVLSAHTYQKDLQQGDPVVWIDPNTQQVHALHGWNVYQILTEDNDKLLSQAFQQLGLPYGYRGIIYLNARKRQLVLAHRGTDLNNMSAIKTDARSIAQNVIGGQERLIPRLLEQAITIAQQEKCTLAVTGHSLGGWLAQITAFIAKSQYPETHVKAITFDSPGAEPMLEQINARINPIPLDQLDITNYLSAPNLINACNKHIGTVYRVVFEQFNPKRTSYTQQSHAIQALIRAFDPTTGDAYQTLAVNSWPLVSRKSLNLTGQMITGDKINAILALCQLVQKCINQEALGEYSGFFKFAKQVNCYHPKPFTKTEEDAFDLAFKYHYNTAPFAPKQLHIRHFPETARQFLKKLYAGSKAHAKVAAQDQLLQAIVWNQQTGWVHIPYETDLRFVCDQLLSTALANPGLAQAVGGLTSLYTTNLLPPPAVSFFVGRAQELRALRQCFQANQERIVAPPITGPGGIGKTQLALRVIKQQVEAAQYAHVFWIPAESAQKLLDAYLRIADGLGMYVDKKDQKQAVQSVRIRLKDRHCLYVFDDAPDIGKLRDFLPLAKGHVLITSRNSDIGAWSTNPLLMDPFSEQEALALAQEFGYGQSKEEEEALQSLLKQVPRYPLTLVQLFSTLEDEGYDAAGWLTTMEHYTATAQEQALITLLSEQPHSRVGYAQSMVYVLKTSLERLAKERKGVEALQLLSQLAYLDPKGIPLEWLLTWDREDTSPLKRKTRLALSLLEKYSLIQWDRSAQQVYIHATVQLMVRHLHPQSTPTRLIHRVVDYIGDEQEAYQNAAQWSSLLPHGRMLFEKLDTPQYPAEAYVLTKYLTKACYVVCLFKEGKSWAERGLQIAQQRYAGQDHSYIARSLSNVAYSLVELGSHQEALKYHKQALAMNKRLYKDQDHRHIAQSLNNVGWCLWELGNHQKALGHFKRALVMGKRLYKDQDHRHIAQSLNNVGYTLGELGSHQEALGYLKQALTMRQRLYKDQDHRHIAQSLDNVGCSLGQLGSHQEALAYKKQALAMNKRLYQGHDNPHLALSLNSVGWSLGQLGSHQEALEYHKQALEIFKRLYQDHDHPRLALSLNGVGYSLGQLGSHQEALAYKKQALAMNKRLYQEQDHAYIAISLDNVGRSLEQLGSYQEALEYHKQALAMNKRLYQEQDHAYIARSLSSVAYSLVELGLHQEALAYHKQALAMNKRLHQDQDHPHIAQSLDNVGWNLWELGNAQEALAYKKQALAMNKRLYQEQEDHPRLALSLNGVGCSLRELGSHQEALGYFKQALSMRQRLNQDQDHPDIARSLNNVGSSLWQLGNHPEALKYHRQALAMSKRLCKDHDHLEIAWSLNHVGYCLSELGSHQEALAYKKQALAMSKRLNQDHDHPLLAVSLANMGLGLKELGSYQEALKYHKQALEIFKRLYQDHDHPWTAFTLHNMGKTLMRSSAYQEGLTYQQEALAMQKRIYREQDHPWLAETLNSLGEALQGLGKLTKAVAYYNQALCMALRVYQQEHPRITQYLNSLIKALNKVTDQAFIQQVKAEVMPLCSQWLGVEHPLTQQLRNVGE